MKLRSKTMYIFSILLIAAIVLSVAGCDRPDVTGQVQPGLITYRADESIGIALNKTADSVQLDAGSQRVEFTKNADGQYILKTYINKDGQWTAFFDAGNPVIQGETFDANPTEMKIVSNTKTKKAVLLSGTHPTQGYAFDILAEVNAGNPLVHFVITNHLVKSLKLDSFEPLIMLWRTGTSDDKVSINQEVPNYQTLDDTAMWKSGFPSSYLYTEGMESAIYFNMSPMTWYSMDGGVKRFRVSQVRTVERDGNTGIGMDLRSENSGKKISAGDMVVDFYLYGNSKAEVPTKMEALDTSVNAFSYSLASTVDWPVNYVDDTLTYEFYVDKIIEGLSAENVSYMWQPARGGTWSDEPVFPERQINKVLERPGYIPGTDLKQTNKSTDFWGDWNCNNNTLMPWILYERLHPDTEQRTLLAKVSSGLLAYFDRVSSIFRSFDVHPGYEGTGLEFTFQNFFMQQGALWTTDFTDTEIFDPALGGKFIQATKGMMNLAHNCKYVFPQLYDATRLTPTDSMDEKRLGVTYEVYSGCIYAYNMCLAYDLTGEEVYLTEAKTAITKLFGGMEFYVNTLKEKLYTDPYEFPINEVSTAPWGVAAAQWIYRITGDEAYLTYSNYIRNITLRMMNWYESALADDPIDQSIGGISFFHAFSATDTTCPWESIMSYMPMLMELKNTDVEPSQVLLKAYNLFRINGFSFSGASWEPGVVSSAEIYQKAITAYYMPEDYYNAETPTIPGQNGANSYMSNALMYSYIMYEAYAKADNKEMMVLNLDITDAGLKMANGIERNFIVLNPLAKKTKFLVVFNDLNEAYQYNLTVTDESDKKTVKKFSGKDLMKGYSVSLNSMEYLRMKVELAETALTDTFTALRQAQVKLMLAYGALQTAAEYGMNDELTSQKVQYEAALALYNSKSYTECISTIDAFYNNITKVE